MDRILERVDRILQGSLGQGRVRRTCRPGSRRRAARRKQAAQCSFPKELNRPSRTISHHRARAGENATDTRNQPRVASEKEAQHRRKAAAGRHASRKRAEHRKSAVTLSSVSIPIGDRKWIFIETQRSHDQRCYEVSKSMTRLPPHDRSVPLEFDGAVLFDDVFEECRTKKFNDASQWPLEDWISKLAKRDRSQEKVSILLESNLFQPLPVPQSKTMYCYQKVLLNTSTRSRM